MDKRKYWEKPKLWEQCRIIVSKSNKTCKAFEEYANSHRQVLALGIIKFSK